MTSEFVLIMLFYLMFTHLLIGTNLLDLFLVMMALIFGELSKETLNNLSL